MNEQLCTAQSGLQNCAKRRGAARIGLATLGVNMFGVGIACYAWLI